MRIIVGGGERLTIDFGRMRIRHPGDQGFGGEEMGGSNVFDIHHVKSGPVATHLNMHLLPFQRFKDMWDHQVIAFAKHPSRPNTGSPQTSFPFPRSTAVAGVVGLQVQYIGHGFGLTIRIRISTEAAFEVRIGLVNEVPFRALQDSASGSVDKRND